MGLPRGLTCISYDRLMTDATSAPTPDDIHRYILDTYPDTIVAAIEGGTFYSCDPANFPNFATVVTSDAFDDASNLSREGAFRLNIGLSRETFQRLVGDQETPDYTALNQLMPHPVYARQHYVSILNPSASTFEDVIKPLLAEAHARTAAQYARREAGRASPSAR
jgi:Family of unknown function (DUF6194)